MSIDLMGRRIALRSAPLVGALACVAGGMPPRLYEMTTETGMPHLEENLRYTTTREQRCLTPQELFVTFPILKHAALADCKLQRSSAARDFRLGTYQLICEGGHGTTGSASWQSGEREIKGTLSITLGGKNMTFYQRLRVRQLGACTKAAAPPS